MNTWTCAFRKTAWIAGMLAVLLAATALAPRGYTASVDVTALAKAADKELRDGQRDMFSGKKDEAIAKLKSAVEKIKKIKAAEPENVKLELLEPKAKKLAKDLERRTGKKLNLFEKPSTPSLGGLKAKLPGASSKGTSAKATPAKASSANLPYNARRPMEQFKAAYTRANDNCQRYATADPRLKDSYVTRVGDALKYMKSQLEEAKKQAAKSGVTSHPDFDEAATQITEIEKKYAALRQKKSSEDAAAKAVAGDFEERRRGAGGLAGSPVRKLLQQGVRRRHLLERDGPGRDLPGHHREVRERRAAENQGVPGQLYGQVRLDAGRDPQAV